MALEVRLRRSEKGFHSATVRRDANGEIGDICAWQNKTLGAYEVQLLWSNRAKACV